MMYCACFKVGVQRLLWVTLHHRSTEAGLDQTYLSQDCPSTPKFLEFFPSHSNPAEAAVVTSLTRTSLPPVNRPQTRTWHLQCPTDSPLLLLLLLTELVSMVPVWCVVWEVSAGAVCYVRCVVYKVSCVISELCGM